jgi:hypothetical protein
MAMAGDSSEIRIATAEDAAAIAQLLYRFNTEFDAATPGVEALRVNAGRPPLGSPSWNNVPRNYI